MPKPNLAPILAALYRYADPAAAVSSEEQSAAVELRTAIVAYNAAAEARAGAAKSRRKKRARK